MKAKREADDMRKPRAIFGNKQKRKKKRKRDRSRPPSFSKKMLDWTRLLKEMVKDEGVGWWKARVQMRTSPGGKKKKKKEEKKRLSRNAPSRSPYLSKCSSANQLDILKFIVREAESSEADELGFLLGEFA